MFSVCNSFCNLPVAMDLSFSDDNIMYELTVTCTSIGIVNSGTCLCVRGYTDIFYSACMTVTL